MKFDGVYMKFCKALTLEYMFFFSEDLDCVLSPESFTEGEGKHLLILYFLEGG